MTNRRSVGKQTKILRLSTLYDYIKLSVQSSDLFSQHASTPVAAHSLYKTLPRANKTEQKYFKTSVQVAA